MGCRECSEDGTIIHARVTAGGSNYGSNGTSNVNISGDGTGAVATVTVASGAITGITINDDGSGYTQASIDNALLRTATSSSGSGATFDIIISPKNGHGADPVEELGGNYVIVNSRLEYAEGSGDFPTDNDFRQIGLITNPTNLGTDTLSSAVTLSALHRFTMASGATMPTVDDYIANAGTITTGTAVARVVSVDSTNRHIYYIPDVDSVGNFGSWSNGNPVHSGTSRGSLGSSLGNLASSNAVSTAYPEVKRYSGDIVYLENRGAVARGPD